MPPIDHLRAALQATFSGAQAEWPPLTDGDVSALVEQGVAPLVYARTHLPELRASAIRAAAIEPLRLEDLREVLGAIASRGVRPLLMKGTPLAYRLYEHPELRPRVDTDVLVDAAAFPAVREGLLALGFDEQTTSGDEHGVRQRMFRRIDRHGIEQTYDVHWKATNTPLADEVLEYHEVEPVLVPAIGPHAWTLPDVEALLLACVHRVAHHQDDERLIWLVDIAMLRSRLTDAEKARFRELASRRRVAALCARSFEVADEWLGPAGWTVGPPARREPSRVLLKHDLTYGGLILADMRALPWRARLTRLRQLAFPPAAFMHHSFPARRQRALPWLYLVRGVRGLMRGFRRMGAR